MCGCARSMCAFRLQPWIVLGFAVLVVSPLGLKGNPFFRAAPPAGCGRVRFVALDTTGRLLRYRVKAFERTDGVALTSLFRGLDADCVSYGRYSYVLARADVDNSDGDLKGELEVREPERVVTLLADPREVVVDRLTYHVDYFVPSEMQVKVSPPPRGPGPNWVRVQSAYTSEYAQVSLDASGLGAIHDFFWGPKVALVFYDGKLVALRNLEVTNAAHMKVIAFPIDLSAAELAKAQDRK